MPEFQTGDIVRVEMPRGYSGRGVLGISLLFSTSAESRFEGAIGTVSEINPVGPQSVHQYLVDFRTHDNGRIGIPWQAQWFREEWLALKERPAVVVTATVAQNAAEATWPDRPAESTPAPEGGIAHPGAKIFTEGRTDFAPPGLDPSQATGTVPESAYGIGGKPVQVESEGDPAAPEGSIIERGDTHVRVRGMAACPDGYPIKGNESSGIYHVPAAASYARTIPEICFVSEEAALAAGYRAPRGRSTTPATETASTDESLAFTGADRADDRSGRDAATFEPTATTMNAPVDTTTPASAPGAMGITASPSGSDLVVERGEGFVKVTGMSVCPDGFPIKGNANSGIFHAPTDSSYGRTVPEICFASEEIAALNGFRAPARRG